ncbi:hypothetical protein N0V92_005733 [Colletotrichum tropicale]|nr:hypothetical protein N0V92_005733 [Colletotrichum tropicale]
MPVESLTHLMFSFAYVTPGDFRIAPMDDLDPKLFNQMTAMKKQNRALKVMVALGGWTFNDPGPTQQVFHDVASSKANRAKFIANLLSFMRQYAFDGVDFDWEYPGADDRGGAEEDGKNFTLLLEELRDAIKTQPLDYTVSFTTPTSFWYLRHFDLKASTAAVDFVNIMSYDLHGVWDAWNPIGSNVLAHTNLTEIKLALDLYWRNEIPPEKLNLGIGFYGRTFELSDASCYKPGCQFKGGAAPGPCTKNSGTLAYREIQDIIKKHNIKPYYDKEHQVKYIVWNQNQWASYDDADTIEAKIKFANSQGLGGLLIWSIDQDTDKLDALTAVVGKDVMSSISRASLAKDSAYWQDMGAQNCYVTDCGGKCDKKGFKAVTTQPCGSAKAVTRRSSKADSTLCCPIDSAPDPADCKWRTRGNAPTCNGRCEYGEVGLQLNKWGDGKYCEDGHKMYCCKTNSVSGHENKCSFNSKGKKCPSGQSPLTFAGEFGKGNIGEKKPDVDFERLNKLKGSSLMSEIEKYEWSQLKLYCCPDEDTSKWNSCEWKGKPRSCFDAHCDLNTQVMLTWAGFGGGEGCFPHPDPNRVRVFCCGPPDGEPLFLPVGLEHLFPNPPTGDDVKTKSHSKIDGTWGGSQSSSADDPNKAAIQFYVMASPTEIQVSVDKRDGSHWELFNCKDAHSHSSQTVQMVCTDGSEESNCKDIFLGNGAPGTIIQMPQGQGCGPGKYAVVESLEISNNQSLPRHLTRRNFSTGGNPVVYDLKFGYDFSLVPREFGDTQLRIDYSNQEGYWNHIVSRPVSKKRKRSLEDFGGSHKRWLEEEWRDDAHFGGITREELHKRWFGDDILEWLEGLTSTNIKMEKRHKFEEQVSAIILQEEWDCEDFKGKVDAVATAGIKMETSFGFALITTLSLPLDLSKSYLHFSNKGSVEAIFTLEALATLKLDSKPFNIAPIYFEGVSFVIPGIMSHLRGQVKAEITVQGRVEARVTVAEWEIQQTYPEESDKYTPKERASPKRGIDKRDLADPVFEMDMQANGNAEFHLMPTMVFGLEFDDIWSVATTDVELVCDGWVRMRANSNLDCGFGYGVDAGMSLIAKAQVPDIFGWQPKEHNFKPLDKTLVPSNGDVWQCQSDNSVRRTIGSGGKPNTFASRNSSSAVSSRLESFSTLQKRLVPYGPELTLSRKDKICPTKGVAGPQARCNEIPCVPSFYEGIDDDDDDELAARDIMATILRPFNSTPDSSEFVARHLEERATGKGKALTICTTKAARQKGTPNTGAKVVKWLPWTSVDRSKLTIYDNADWSDCDNMNFGIQTTEQTLWRPGKTKQTGYIIEHVLEAQSLQTFFSLDDDTRGMKDICDTMAKTGWFKTTENPTSGEKDIYPMNWVVQNSFPSGSFKSEEFINVIELVNHGKEGAFKTDKLHGEKELMKESFWVEGPNLDAAVRTLKTGVQSFKYLNHPDIRVIFKTQADRVGEKLEQMEQWLFLHPKGDDPYQYLGLQAKWNAYIKGRVEVAAAKLVTFVDTYLERGEAVLANTDPIKDDPDRARRRRNLQVLRNTLDNDMKGQFVNPFP